MARRAKPETDLAAQMRTDAPLSVRCPFCRQDPGSYCLRLPGEGLHESRRARWLWDQGWT